LKYLCKIYGIDNFEELTDSLIRRRIDIKGHFSPINRNDGFFHQELERIEHIFQHVDFQ
jgi:hypothetical protein